jgi:hypothetical protein
MSFSRIRHSAFLVSRYNILPNESILRKVLNRFAANAYHNERVLRSMHRYQGVKSLLHMTSHALHKSINILSHPFAESTERFLVARVHVVPYAIDPNDFDIWVTDVDLSRPCGFVSAGLNSLSGHVMYSPETTALCSAVLAVAEEGAVAVAFAARRFAWRHMPYMAPVQ